MNQNARILIAENDCIIAEDINLLLKSWGHWVINVTQSIEQTYRIIDRQRPDLVILSACMIDSNDGLEEVKRIIQQYGTSIILITDSLNTKIKQSQKLYGSFYVILKPFDADELNLLVEIALLNCAKSLKKKRFLQSYRSIFQRAPKDNKQYLESLHQIS